MASILLISAPSNLKPPSTIAL
jgi:hypothetical protein